MRRPGAPERRDDRDRAAEGHALEPRAPVATARPGGQGRGAAGEEARRAGDPALRPRASHHRRAAPDRRRRRRIAYRALVDALAAAGRSDLAALAWPSRDLRVDLVDPGPPAGTAPADRFAAPPPLVRGTAARALVPGQSDPAAEKAAQAFERLLELVLATAPEESAIRRIGRALAHTVRQVNVLEQRVAVDLARALVRVRRTLDEREREESVRLRRIAARAAAELCAAWRGRRSGLQVPPGVRPRVSIASGGRNDRPTRAARAAPTAAQAPAPATPATPRSCSAAEGVRATGWKWGQVRFQLQPGPDPISRSAPAPRFAAVAVAVAVSPAPVGRAVRHGWRGRGRRVLPAAAARDR